MATTSIAPVGLAVDTDRRGIAPFGPAIDTGGAGRVTVIPVCRGGTPLGAFVVTDGRVRYRPVIGADRVVAATLAVAALGGAAAALLAARRRPAVIRTVTMGPGGWLSLKGLPGAVPPVVPGGHRPWWARVLRAHRLSG